MVPSLGTIDWTHWSLPLMPTDMYQSAKIDRIPSSEMVPRTPRLRPNAANPYEDATDRPEQIKDLPIGRI